jgi:hypothetical protein
MLMVACDAEGTIVAVLPVRWAIPDEPTPRKGTECFLRPVSGKRFPSAPVTIKLMAFSPEAVTADSIIKFLDTGTAAPAQLVPVPATEVAIPPSSKNGVASRRNDNCVISGSWVGVATYTITVEYRRYHKSDPTLQVSKIRAVLTTVDPTDPVIIAEHQAVLPFFQLVAKYYKMVNAEAAVQKVESDLKDARTTLEYAEKSLESAQRNASEARKRFVDCETALEDLRKVDIDCKADFKRARLG